MLTSAECRAQAEQKLAQAERDDRNRKRLITAAEAWLFLASQLRRAEATFGHDEAVTKRRSKSRVSESKCGNVGGTLLCALVFVGEPHDTCEVGITSLSAV